MDMGQDYRRAGFWPIPTIEGELEMAFDIRQLTSVDSAAWWNLRLEALQHEPEAFGEDAEEHAATCFDSPHGPLVHPLPGCFVLGAFCGGRLIATMGLFRQQRRKSWHKARLWGVYVTLAFRGKGLARKLLTALIERAKAEGLEQILLTVNVDQTAACRLYAAAGFQRTGHEEHALKVGDRYVNEDYFLLWLT